MRKFRAIVEINKEPEDKEVLWFYKKELYYFVNGNWEKFISNASLDNLNKEEILNIVNEAINDRIGDFSPTAEKVSYSNNDYPNITNVKEALDELLYIEPKIISFSIKEAGVYEKGNVLNSLNFSYEVNKISETQLIMNNQSGSLLTAAKLKESFMLGALCIKTDTSYTLMCMDSKGNSASATQSIKFIDYIYYGSFKNNTYTKLGKIPSTSNSFNVNIGDGENLWIFIPTSSSYKKIVFNEADSTSDFNNENYTNTADTKVNVNGIRYTSKNTGFGNITITLQK